VSREIIRHTKYEDFVISAFKFCCSLYGSQRNRKFNDSSNEGPITFLEVGTAGWFQTVSELRKFQLK